MDMNSDAAQVGGFGVFLLGIGLIGGGAVLFGGIGFFGAIAAIGAVVTAIVLCVEMKKGRR